MRNEVRGRRYEILARDKNERCEGASTNADRSVSMTLRNTPFGAVFF
jgi:hypothetical protein